MKILNRDTAATTQLNSRVNTKVLKSRSVRTRQGHIAGLKCCCVLWYAVLFCLCSMNSVFALDKKEKTHHFASLAPILKKIMPAVVNITIQGPMRLETQAIKKQAYGRFQGIGSGVIIDAKQGFIVTNAHVIKNAKLIDVTLHNGRRVKARLIGMDPASDIAVIKIKALGLSSLVISDSNRLQVGDFVVAIGNPFGLNPLGTNQTATFGIVSATQRSELRLDGGIENFIQTDAAINPGNSGGALVNTRGELVGINTAIVSPYGGNVGIGLAIPSNMILSISKQIIQYGSVKRGLIGIFVQQLTPELAESFQIKEKKGALITQINPHSPAEKSGLKVGDVVLKINKNTVTDAAQVKNLSSLLRVGSTAELQIYRNQSIHLIKVKIADLRSHEQSALQEAPFFYGVILRNLEQSSETFGLIQGIQVVAISETAPAQRSGLRPGDVITHANHVPVHNLNDLKKNSSNRSKLLLRVLRGSGAIFVVVQ